MEKLELIATVFALLSIFLIVKQKQISWIFVSLASLQYMVIFWRSGLFTQGILQIFFIFSAAYGYYSWGKDSESVLKPAFGSWRFNLIFIGMAALFSWLNWKFSSKIFSTEIVFLDSLTSIFSILAMLLATRKKTESWIYWLVIDSFSIYLFISTALYPTAAVYFVYILMSIWGLRDWLKSKES